MSAGNGVVVELADYRKRYTVPRAKQHQAVIARGTMWGADLLTRAPFSLQTRSSLTSEAFPRSFRALVDG